MLAACASGALWGGLLYWRRRGAGPITAHLLSVAQTLLVAQVGLGLLLLSGHHHAAHRLHYAYGSLALGAALATVAILIKQELLLFIVGGVFLLEGLSVVIQVASFKMTGQRVFRMAPLHHHFEKSGWRETQVVVRFWMITKRLMILGSLHPIFSKWWWSGAILNTRWPVILNDAT